MKEIVLSKIKNQLLEISMIFNFTTNSKDLHFM